MKVQEAVRKFAAKMAGDGLRGVAQLMDSALSQRLEYLSRLSAHRPPSMYLNVWLHSSHTKPAHQLEHARAAFAAID